MDNLMNLMEPIISVFNEYYCNVRYLTLLLFAIIISFALIKKEDKYNRFILVYLPIILILVIMNPWTYKFLFQFTGGVYWRLFWLIPLAPIVAYGITKLVKEKEGIVGKTIIVILGIFVIVFSGNNIFQEKNYQKVFNIYKAPDDILGAIMIISAQNKDNKKVMCPTNVVPWVRQYDANINIEYKRKSTGKYEKFITDFDLGRTIRYMDKYLEDGCNFFILDKSVKYSANLEEYGYSKIGETVTYDVYMLNE